MDIFGVLALVGGLALFLYGMETMSAALSKASGGRLEKILEKLTSNKLKGVALGALVTAIIQSSSATTVMVVGFVNSGIMRLSQAVGVIMGANIGTTATSWILSLASLEGDSLLVRMLKPSTFTPVLAAIGVVIILFSKKERQKDWAQILLGFAVLMYGMEAMSTAVEPLASDPAFMQLFTMFQNPLLGLAAGAVLTAIIQSSSASVGILQALAATGAVGWSAAVPIIMGQNIGTCVTALLSSVGAQRNAKRAALVHLYFNIIGTAIFMAVFYSLNALIDFSFMGQAVNATGIAIVHSVFNIFATIILLPFSKVLEKLAYLTVPRTAAEQAAARESEGPAKRLDERFLQSPGIALEQCGVAARDMAARAEKALGLAIGLLNRYDEEEAGQVARLEAEVDGYEDALGSYLVKLSSCELSTQQSREVSLYLHCLGDFERISDHAVNVMGSAKELHDKGLSFSKQGKAELDVYTSAVMRILNLAVTAFDTQNEDTARTVEPLETVVDDLREELKDRHVERLRTGACTIEMGFILTDVVTDCERVADHCSNVAVSLLQMQQKDTAAPHAYAKTLEDQAPEFFRKKSRHFAQEYALPPRA